MSLAARERLQDGAEEDVFGRGSLMENRIPRRSTAEALELITRSETQTLAHSEWYEPGRDFCFYAAAHDACRGMKTRLKALKLTDEELESVNSARGLDVLMQRIQQTTEDQERASKKHDTFKKVGQFVETFSEFVTRTSGIIELLCPQSIEYRATYGVILLVFKTVFKRKETQESLLTYIKKLSNQLPIIDFYGRVLPSNGMKILVVSIYVEILNFLNQAVVYYRSNHLRQLRDAVLRPVETKFDKCVQRIEAEVKKLMELKDAALVAHQVGMKEVVESTGQVVGRLHETFNQSMTAFGSCLALLDARIENIAQQSSELHSFQAVNHSLALTEVLLPTASTADEQLSSVRDQTFYLSPKDHWYENGVVEAFKNWSTYGRTELLWIGGRSGNQDSWVTEMSIDLIDALQMQDLTLLHVFCDTSNKLMSVTTLMKHLIAQLIDLHPELAFRQPRTYNVRNFRRATSFKKLWQIFESLVGELTSGAFILIDRIDECNLASEPDGNKVGDESHLFLPYLMGLAAETEHVSVIVTSTDEAPEEIIGAEELRLFYRDTRKSRRKREG